MRYSLKTKLIGRFAIVLLLMIFVGSVGIYFSNSVQNRHEELVNKIFSPIGKKQKAGLAWSLHYFRYLKHLNRELAGKNWTEK